MSAALTHDVFLNHSSKDEAATAGLSLSASTRPGGGVDWELAVGVSPVGYNDWADISEGLTGVYLKFKQLKVPATIHQQSTLNHQLLRNNLACGRTIPNPPANGSNASRRGGFLKRQ